MTPEQLSSVGTALAITGTVASIYGAVVFNQWKDYTQAKMVWAISNPMLLVWALGYIAGYWDGSLSVAALACLYAVYTISNWWGLLK